jgi:hypothetical protein
VSLILPCSGRRPGQKSRFLVGSLGFAFGKKARRNAAASRAPIRQSGRRAPSSGQPEGRSSLPKPPLEGAPGRDRTRGLVWISVADAAAECPLGHLIGTDAKLSAFLKRNLPDRWMDAIIFRLVGLPRGVEHQEGE